MSDADNQMGGHGGETGRDPADQSDEAPDPVTGNTGKAFRPAILRPITKVPGVDEQQRT
jgi:hypothetical protein